MRTITITLTDDEAQSLDELAAEHKTNSVGVLEAFASDLTGSLRNGGSDERLFARQWFDRCLMPDFTGDLAEPDEVAVFAERADAAELDHLVSLREKFRGFPLAASMRDGQLYIGEARITNIETLQHMVTFIHEQGKVTVNNDQYKKLVDRFGLPWPPALP